MFFRRFNRRTRVGKIEDTFTRMLDIPGLEAIVRDAKTKRDVKDNARIGSLRKRSGVLQG